MLLIGPTGRKFDSSHGNDFRRKLARRRTFHVGIGELIVGAGCYLRVVVGDVSHAILLLLLRLL